MKQFFAVMVVALLLAGCVNISDAAKASGFGKNAKEQKALDYYSKKYGDPSGTGAPRIMEPLMTTSVKDFMPADRVLKYNNGVSAFNVWFFYDNFGTGDKISVEFKYLDDGVSIHTFTANGGGDYGAATFALSKPDDGWPNGNYAVVISGKGVSETVEFEVIDGATATEALPYETGGLVGNDADEHGCIGSAGYSWCEASGKCIRSWEENCTASAAPAAPPAGAVPTTSGMTSDKIVFDTTPGYIGACSLTDKSKFTLSKGISASLLQVWYNWGAGEGVITYTLEKDGEDFMSGSMVRADCDPYQGNWCNGNHAISKVFPAGSYELKLTAKKMCLEPGKTGTVRIYGEETAGAAAPAAALPAGVPAHLGNCNYAGTWSTDWGTMVLKQDGSKVTGTYTHDSGKISGTLVDGVYVGKWSEYPSYSEPGDAGDMVFYFTKDCNGFSGTWHYGVHTSGAWSGGWVGTKAS